MSALDNLGEQFHMASVEHMHTNFKTSPYDRHVAVGTLSGYQKRYNPQKITGIKHHPVKLKYRDTGFHG